MMKNWLFAVLLLVPTLMLPAVTLAGGLSAEQGWIRAVPPVSPNSAGYLMLHNDSDQDRVLVGVSSSAANAVEMHTVIEQDGATTMQQLQQLAVPKQDCVLFEPGGNHIMFIGLKQPLKLDETVKLTLHFKNGDSLDVTLQVKPGQASAHQHHDHH